MLLTGSSYWQHLSEKAPICRRLKHGVKTSCQSFYSFSLVNNNVITFPKSCFLVRCFRKCIEGSFLSRSMKPWETNERTLEAKTVKLQESIWVTSPTAESENVKRATLNSCIAKFNYLAEKTGKVWGPTHPEIHKRTLTDTQLSQSSCFQETKPNYPCPLPHPEK